MSSSLRRLARSCSSLRNGVLLSCLLSTSTSIVTAQSIDLADSDLLCPLVAYERQRDLEDARFELELTENEYRARRKLFVMIEKLWAARSIEREVYLDYKRLRDRTRVRMARLKTRIEQLDSETEQVSLACGQAGNPSNEQTSKKIAALHAEYRRLDCELLARDLEIAAIDQEFDAAVLEATRALIEGNIKSRYELVIDEFDHDQSKARVESFAARTAACRRQLEQ